MIANIWARPMSNASRPRMLSSERVTGAARSTSQSRTPITMSAPAISAGARNACSAYLSSSTPAMPPGIVAMIEEEHAAFFRRRDLPRAHDVQRRAREAHPLRAEISEHRDQRAEVQRDVEGESGLGPAEEPRREREMRGAADRQELGEALENAEHQRLEESHCEGNG